MTTTFDHQYREVTKAILRDGIHRPNRTGVGTLALPAAMVSHDLSLGFPLLTLKRTPIKSVAVELEGFLHGVTDKAWYQERGCTIWDEWCSPSLVSYGTGEDVKSAMKKEKYLGPIYGEQWRNFDGCDQLKVILRTLEESPDSRRMVCSAWNPVELDVMALPPCHFAWQVLVIDGRLHLNWHQRSADWFLGVPFNMASYALLALLLANQFGFAPGQVTGFFGDTHLYENQYDLASELVERTPRSAPVLHLPFGQNILDWKHTDLDLVGYDPHPAMRVEVVV